MQTLAQPSPCIQPYTKVPMKADTVRHRSSFLTGRSIEDGALNHSRTIFLNFRAACDDVGSMLAKEPTCLEHSVFQAPVREVESYVRRKHASSDVTSDPRKCAMCKTVLCSSSRGSVIMHTRCRCTSLGRLIGPIASAGTALQPSE